MEYSEILGFSFHTFETLISQINIKSGPKITTSLPVVLIAHSCIDMLSLLF